MTPLEEVMTFEQDEILHKLINRLSPRWKHAIKGRLNGRTFSALAKEAGITRECVRQRYNRGIRTIQNRHLQVARLKDSIGGDTPMYNRTERTLTRQEEEEQELDLPTYIGSGTYVEGITFYEHVLQVLEFLFPLGTEVKVTHQRGTYYGIVVGYDQYTRKLKVSNLNTHKLRHYIPEQLEIITVTGDY